MTLYGASIAANSATYHQHMRIECCIFARHFLYSNPSACSGACLAICGRMNYGMAVTRHLLRRVVGSPERRKKKQHNKRLYGTSVGTSSGLPGISTPGLGGSLLSNPNA